MQQYTQIIFFVAIIAVFYFLIIRPQKKRQKDQVELMKTLVPGAEILTIGGIYGTIVSVDDDRVRIAVADGSELVMAKRAIAQVIATAPEDTDDESVDDVDDEPAGDIADEAVGSEGDEEAVDPAAQPANAATEDDSTDV
jgi:preprotein translocase subunit YajC